MANAINHTSPFTPEPEEGPTKPVKRSPLFGVSRTKVIALDKGVQRTIDSTIQRWLRNRIEFLESLPEATRLELEESGAIVPPTLNLNAAYPAPPAAQRAPARPPVPAATAGRLAPGAGQYRKE